MKRSFKRLMSSGHKPIGTFMQIPSEEVAEIMGCSGVEFLVLDMEHCPMSHAKVVSMIRACESVGIIPLVRVPDVTDEDSIKKVLDAGAAGLIIPNISTEEQARLAVRYSKFSPVGERGACPYVRANWFGTQDCGSYYDQANQETMVILLVEGPEGIANLSEIMKVQGIDGVQIGTVDLSVALGIPGQMNHPKIKEGLKQAAKQAASQGKFLGYFCMELEDIYEVRDWEGIGYYLCTIPETVIHKAYQEMIKTMQSALVY